MSIRPSQIGAKSQAEMDRMIDAMRMLDYEREFNRATDTLDGSRDRFKAPNEFDYCIDAVVLEKIPSQKKVKNEFDDIFG